MKTEIEEILECLIDEITASGEPSEATIYLLARYEDRYDIITEYFNRMDNVL